MEWLSVELERHELESRTGIESEGHGLDSKRHGNLAALDTVARGGYGEMGLVVQSLGSTA
jgi:hypothetical protein